MRNQFAISTLLLMSVSVAACAPRYQSRSTAIEPPRTLATSDTQDAAFEAAWWRQFQDPVLDGLVNQALAANRDLQAAVSRYEGARQLANAANLLPLPQGGPSVGIAAQRLSGAEAGAEDADRSFRFVSTGVGFAWEADLFGRLRGIRRAAAADAGASAMDVRGAQVAITAQVAAAYFELRGAEGDLTLMERLQGRTSEQLKITHTLVAAGRVTRLDLLRAQQVDEELATARSAALHRIERARNRLATLTGQAPDALRIAAAPMLSLRTSALAIGAAGELLQRRPDVAAAELRVLAARARVDVARAELFPRVDVTGTIGLVAGSVGRLAEASAGSWLIAPRLVWNALDWPRLRREHRAAGAFADAAFAEYEQVVLQALEETHTALDAYTAASRELLAYERRAQAASDAAGIVFVQYREGLVDSLSRTQADRDAIAGLLDANRALTAQRLAVVDVYRALGGGWR